jgi:capsular exopolysaccharide synthesis family protein
MVQGLQGERFFEHFHSGSFGEEFPEIVRKPQAVKDFLMTEENKIQLYKPRMLDSLWRLSSRTSGPNAGPVESDIDLFYILRVLRDRRRVILVAVIVAGLAAGILSLLMKPVYRSQATIEVREALPDIESLQQLQIRNAAPNDVVVTEVETEIGILKSQTLARQVIDQLNLAKQQEASFSLSGMLSAAWRRVVIWCLGPGDSRQTNVDGKAYERLLSTFASSLTVDRVGSSRLVRVAYESGDPRLSARVVNAVVNDYLKLHESSTEKLTKDLAEQVKDAKRELEESEAKMTKYARSNGLLYLQNDNGTSQNIVDERLRQIQEELTKAQADRYQKESVYQLVQKGDYGSLPGVFQDRLLQDLTVQVADLERQYAQLSATFSDNYPKVQQIKSQLTAVKEALARERERAAANITDQYLSAVHREALLLKEFQRQMGLASSVAEKSNQYNILKRSADSDSQLYDDLLRKVKEADLVARIRANNVDIVDWAEPQYLPVKPNILLNLAVGMILGLAVGIALAFFQDRLDTSLKTPDEVDRFLGVPALAMIPSVESLPELVSNGNNHNGNGLSLPDVFNPSDLSKSERSWYRIDKQLHQEYSPLVEAFRTLGSSVMLEASGQKRTLRSLVITSSQPGEGKTTVSVNLAIALAQQGKRVILIDADLRRPCVHRALGFRNIRGLSSYLGGLSEWAPCVLPGLTPGLDTLPAGKTPRNPVALLSSSRMKTLLDQALEEYEYVIVDSPALMPSLADARILACLVDGSILVVRSGMAPREYVIRARKHLNNVFGVVLNSMDVRSPDYYYYGYGAYGYGPRNDDQEPGEDSYGKRIAEM